MKNALMFCAPALVACASTPQPVAQLGPTSWRTSYAAAKLEPIRPQPDDQVVSREVVFDVPRPVDEYYADFLIGGARLENYLPGTRDIPGVDHNEDLTPSVFPAVGSQRLVCLKQGGWAVEEVLELRERGFRYLVSNYSLRETRPIQYGIGEFRFAPLTPTTTRVTWRYSFKLRSDRFPGSLGGLGRWLFRTTFLESDYARFMEAGVVAMKAWATRPRS
jgi:hypothetical protein